MSEELKKLRGTAKLPTRVASKVKTEAGIDYGEVGKTYTDHLDVDVVGKLAFQMRATGATWKTIYPILGTQSPGQAFDVANRWATKQKVEGNSWKLQRAKKVEGEATKTPAKKAAAKPKGEDAPKGSRPAKRAEEAAKKAAEQEAGAA